MILWTVALAIALRRLYIRGPALISEWEANELWYTRFLLHNGLAVYGCWLGYIFLLNLGLVIHRHTQLSVDIVGTICLAAGLIGTSIYFVVDVFMYDQYCRYIFSPYIIDMLYPLGVVSSHWSIEDSSSALASMLLGISFVFLAAKFCLMLFRHLKYPLYSDEDKCFPVRPNYGTIEYENQNYDVEE